MAVKSGLIAAVGFTMALSLGHALAAEQRHDVVVYGATSGGITAAIQARAMGKTAIIVEPGQHVGGLSAGGLGATDIGNKAAIGGLSREFYRRIGRHYARPESWTHERPESSPGQRKAADTAEMWKFEPHVAERVFRDWLAEAGVEVVMNERLDLAPGGVEKEGRRIVAFKTETGKRFAGTMFIDATYEGDLMAKAGVSYHVGREAQSVYGESLNGIRTGHAHKHQFTHDVDPYVVPGDPTSGLIPLVSPDPPGTDGDGDRRMQAYNFRMCTTDVPENRRDWPKPEGYDEKEYELLLRKFEAGDDRSPWNPVRMPNRKTDTNNGGPVSTDYIGANYEYPEADHAQRERIVADHRRYQQGLMWTLANHPRVPEKVRADFQRLGLAKDEFVDNDNWPHQLYVREARRLVSDYVMTQADCQWKRAAEDPVGLGAYNMDSHNCQRYVTAAGKVRNEGDIQVGVKPYGISYRSIRPRREECENLLVPVCLAASHIAYGSIRMEPVFMVLGQSAATAAVMAIESDSAVQEVEYPRLRERLLSDSQVLQWGAGRDEGNSSPESLFFRNLRAGTKQTVVVYGTSLSHGGAWAKATKEWFEQRHPGLVTFVNSSGPGQHSDWGVKHLGDKVLAHRPNLVIIEFAYNDCVDRFHLPVEQGAANLQKMIETIRGKDPTTAIVLQVMNVGWDAPNGRKSFSSRLRLQEFNDNYRAAAKAHGLTLLDHYPNWLDLKKSDPERFQRYVPDGTHPNEEGSLAITWPTVKKWLERSR